MTLAFDAPRIQEVVGSLSRKMLINGEWVDAASGKTFDSINPATEEVLASVAHGEAEDADRAVRAARAAFEDGSAWRKMPHGQRGKIIHKLGDLILEHLEEFAMLESLDNGKPFAVAKAADVPLAADLFHYMSGWATKIEGSTIPISALRTPTRVPRRSPCASRSASSAQIIPWNFPLLMAAWKLGPALAAGCTIVLKPAEQTPLSALLLGELAHARPGCRRACVNIVTGFGERRRGAGRAPGRRQGRLHRLHRGRQADRHRRRRATSRRSRSSWAASRPTSSTPTPTWTRPSRAPRTRSSSTRAVLRRRLPAVRRGVGLRPGRRRRRRAGPQHQGRQRARRRPPRWARWSRPSSSTGSPATSTPAGRRRQAIIGGDRVGDKGYFVAPTVLTGTREEMKAVQEEIFGPVVAAAPFNDRQGHPAHGQQHQLRPGRGRLHPRHQQGLPHRAPAAGRHGLGQHLERLRRHAALRWLQGVGLGPGDGLCGLQQLHGDQDGHHRPELTRAKEVPAG